MWACELDIVIEEVEDVWAWRTLGGLDLAGVELERVSAWAFGGEGGGAGRRVALIVKSLRGEGIKLSVRGTSADAERRNKPSVVLEHRFGMTEASCEAN